LKIVTVMTGAAPGGAEFAAVELLDALIGRGHEAVMLSDSPEIGRETRVEVHPLELGHDRARVALLGVVHVSEALVVGVVQQSGDGPELLVAAQPPRVGDHRRLDRQAVDLDLAPFIAEQRATIDRRRSELDRLEAELVDLGDTIAAAGRARSARKDRPVTDSPVRVLFV